jgi:hypothetical protein
MHALMRFHEFICKFCSLLSHEERIPCERVFISAVQQFSSRELSWITLIRVACRKTQSLSLKYISGLISLEILL